MLRPILALLTLTTCLPAGTLLFQSFEGDGFDGWKTEGTAFGMAPVSEKTDEMTGSFTAYANDRLAASSHGGDLPTGTLTSPEFTINEPYIAFLITGGNEPGKTAAQLIIDGKVVRESTGRRNLRCEPALWNVADLVGKKASIRLIDDAPGPWGIIGVDHILFTDYPNQKFPPSTRAGKAFVKGLKPGVAVPGSNIPLDSTLSVEATFAAQKVTSPTALAFDDQGRVYITETHRFRNGVEDNRDRLFWYLDDLASKKTSDRRNLYEKWKGKLPIEKLTEKSEVIRRLADTDGDGKLDESKVFADGFNDPLDGTAAGIFYYEGSIYFACIPKITMLRDSNGDGTADERKAVAEGFGVRVSLSGHDLNGFALGPDGRIYGTIGDRGFSVITKEGVSYDYPNQGAAFRFEPDGSGFEIFHTGLRNPKEIAFDALGNPFTVDNNSDQGDAARVVYLVEGGDSGWEMEHQAMHTFHRQIGLEERPPSRWMDEKMWELENPVQPSYILPPSAYLTSGPSGLTYHPGAGFLESEADHFLICDYRGGSANSGIWSFQMKPKGAGMEMTDSRQFLWGIAATDVEYSWDGRLFITDFITGWTAHEDGRLLSLSAGEKTWQAAEVAGTTKIMREGFENRSSAVLANLLKHPDARIRLRAQIALTRKPDALEKFKEASGSSISQVRLHGIWGLGILSRRGASPLPFAAFSEVPTVKSRIEAERALVGLLKDKDPEIRAQALRALADSNNPNPDVPLGPLLADESTRVRFFAAILAGKRKMIGYYGPICDLLAENNNRDVYLRHAGIYALQNMVPKAFTISALSLNESAAVRLAATIALRRMKSEEVAVFLNDADPKIVDEAIRAVCDLNLVGARPLVAAFLDDLSTRSWTPFMLRRLLFNSYRLGTAEDAARLLKFAADSKNPERERKEAMRLISIWNEPPPVDQFSGHFAPLPKRDPKILRAVLTAALPELLRQEGFVLSSALGLVSQYKMTIAGLGEKTLRVLIGNAALPAAARANALELLMGRKPKDAAKFLAGLTGDKQDEVALAALSRLMAISPDAALPAIEAAINSGITSRVQKSWPILATATGPKADAIFIRRLEALKISRGIAPDAIELLAAARSRKNPEVVAAVAALDQAIAADKDPLAKWNLALEGGDANAGAAVFTSHPASECMRCHRADDGHTAGGETAPNLAGIAKRHRDHRYFLESMIQPSAFIAPGYGTVLIEFKNGASLSGMLVAETADHVDLETPEKLVRIQRADIASLTPPVSPMPPMGDLLKPEEIRDLIAWLGTLDKGGEEVKRVLDPEPLDLAKLPVPAKSTAAAGIDPEVLKSGKQQFLLCGACHGQAGEGTAAAPPLAGSEWVNGPAENLIRIQLRGLQGPIKVKGQEYNMPGGMAALAYQTDEQVAAVLTYIRSSFGNSAPPVTPAEVAALRGEVGKPQVRAEELKAPAK